MGDVKPALTWLRSRPFIVTRGKRLKVASDPSVSSSLKPAMGGGGGGGLWDPRLWMCLSLVVFEEGT